MSFIYSSVQHFSSSVVVLKCLKKQSWIKLECFFSVSQAEERRRGSHTESNGFGNHSNNGNLPDLVQQSNSPSATPTSALQELSDMAEVRHTHPPECTVAQ